MLGARFFAELKKMPENVSCEETLARNQLEPRLEAERSHT